MGNLPTTLAFREACPADVSEIIELLADDALGKGREAFGDAVDPAYLKAFEAIDLDPNNRLIVAEVDSEVVGCMQLTLIPHLTFKGGIRMQIEGVRVKGTFRGRGVGATMIEWAVASALEEGCHLVQLTSNKTREDALRFYEEQGFEPSHVGYKLYLR
ncbi:MAG: GNAT family N-acetyltransferase [Geminicoccaceae bacterium]